MAAATPAAIGRYKVVTELGRGAMGIVYQAADPVIDREVALKTIRNSEGLDAKVYQELRDRFLNEARAAGRLQHPNIVSVLDAGTDEASGISFIAMEFVRGGDLESELEAGRRFAPAEAVAIIAAVADALEFAHARGVVHRDIKPANLLRDESGAVKITDFGIARLNESGVTRTGQILGSPAYMSPEQIAGSKVDSRSDIFSLGVVLYQLLTGEKPFLGESMTTLAYQIVNTEPIPLRKINPTVPEAYEQVVERALAKSADERYQSAAELASDLRGEAQRPVSGARTASGTVVTGAAEGGTTIELGAGVTAGGTVVDASASRPAAAPPRPGSQRPRWLVPAVAAGALLALVVAFAALRGDGDAAESAGQAASTEGTPSAGAAQVEPARSTEPSPDPADEPGFVEEASNFLESVREEVKRRGGEPAERSGSSGAAPGRTGGTGEKARLLIDFEHHIEDGTVRLSLDGTEIWSAQLRARKKKRFGIPKLKLAHGEINEEVSVPAGPHLLAVTVESRRSGVDDTELIRLDLRSDWTNLLKIRVDRVTHSVSLSGRP